jgi:electron transfer flavoprotein beta subunit
VAQSGAAIETASAKHSMNPFDELAIEEAVQLREQPAADHPVEAIIAVSAGPAKAADVLRTALAMGADTAIHIQTDGAADAAGGASVSEGRLEPLAVAKALRKVVDEQGVNLVLLGKQSIDDDMGTTGPMLAGLLGWSQATQAAKVLVGGEAGGEGRVQVVKEVDGGVETVRASLPMVVTTDLRLNTPRYAKLPNIMKAKKKPITVLKAEEMGIDISARLKTVKIEEPPARQGGVKVEDVGQFVGKLKELGAL